MKKIIFSAFILATAFVSLNSCRKKDPNQTLHSKDSVNSTEKLLSCPLSNVTTSTYSSLGTTLFGTLNGMGTTGSIDAHLNCAAVAGPPCNRVNANFIFITSYSSDVSQGTHVLSDGVMTVAEQNTLVSQIQSTCNAHKNSTYGSSYIINKYDVYFMQTLCGGCPDGMVVYVDYKAAQICRN